MKSKRKLPAEVEADLRLISQNMKLSGFSGQITPQTVQRALELHHRDPLLKRGDAYLLRVLGGVTPDQRSSLEEAKNEVEYFLMLAKFALVQSRSLKSRKQAFFGSRVQNRSAKRWSQRGGRSRTTRQ